MNMDISPYDGDTFHESPLFLHFYKVLVKYFFHFIPYLFIVIDVLTALVLSRASYIQMQQLSLIESKRMSNLKNEDIEKLTIKSTEIKSNAFKVAIIYLLSPYSLVSCADQSTSTITNFFMALILLTSSSGYRMSSAFLLALLSYQAAYPVMFIVPLMMIIEQQRNVKSFASKTKKSDDVQFECVNYQTKAVISSMICTMTIFLMFLFGLIMSSYFLMEKNWDFVYSTYLFL